jgi:hypothetical protein
MESGFAQRTYPDSNPMAVNSPFRGRFHQGG